MRRPPRHFWAALLAVAPVAVSPPPAQSQSIEEVIVVGSRIQKPDYAFSNPVQSVDAEVIRFSGTTNLTNFLKDYPALVGSFDSNQSVAAGTAFVGSTGLTLLNLRNFGEERTLVLVDGRRHVAGLPGSAAVDVDTIPIELIERIEILTGGASAIYGAAGAVDVDFDFVEDFNGTDTSWDEGTIPFIAPFYQQDGDGSPTDLFISDLLPRKERRTINAFIDYDLFPQANLFGELKYSRRDSFARRQPTFDYYFGARGDLGDHLRYEASYGLEVTEA